MSLIVFASAAEPAYYLGHATPTPSLRRDSGERNERVSDRVCIYIDGANFYPRCQQALKRTDVDFEAFGAKIVGADRKLVRIYYYTAPLNQDAAQADRDAQQAFFRYLNEVPYLELRLGRLVKRKVKCGKCQHERATHVQKGVDLRLGVDMVAHASRRIYDVAVLVSGDGDFVDAVHAVKEHGKHVEVVTFPYGLSQELVRAADTTTKLTASYFSGSLLRKSALRAVPGGVGNAPPG